MKRTTKHVALDVHQATTVASVREDSGRVIARSILPTEEPAIVEFFRGMRGTIPGGSVACAPAATSRIPLLIVERETPVARSTSAIPPWPSAAASAAAHSRRPRSVKAGATRRLNIKHLFRYNH